MNEEKKPVWFITGCSTGFGREIVRHVLDQGYRVVATSRNLKDIENLGNDAANRICRLKLDVTRPDEITSAVVAAEEHFGHIDVLVNNAGVGYFGAIEESDQNDVRRMFEVNFWGLANMTRAVLPGMRRRRAGHIVNLSSIGGVRGSPAVGYYNATKFAVEGFSEALAAEVTALWPESDIGRAQRVPHRLGRTFRARGRHMDRRLRLDCRRTSTAVAQW